MVTIAKRASDHQEQPRHSTTPPVGAVELPWHTHPSVVDTHPSVVAHGKRPSDMTGSRVPRASTLHLSCMHMQHFSCMLNAAPFFTLLYSITILIEANLGLQTSKPPTLRLYPLGSHKAPACQKNPHEDIHITEGHPRESGAETLDVRKG